MKKILMIAMIIALPVAYTYAADEKADQKKVEEPKKAEKEKSKGEYIADLNSTNSEDTILAAEDWVGSKQEEGAIDNLLTLLKGDKRDKVRMNAAVAFGLIGKKESGDMIAEFVGNETSADVRYSEVLAIARAGYTKKGLDKLMAARDKETDPFILDFIKKMEEKIKSK
jgi:HEAT repeat protein